MIRRLRQTYFPAIPTAFWTLAFAAISYLPIATEFFLPPPRAIAQEGDSDSVDRDYSSELPRIDPLSPEEALKSFEILEPFSIELIASEPLVMDPVAFAFDARGRLWVVEMRDYSEQDTERLGRVALLSDTNGDGVMDHRTTFVEDLSWPTAIWPWRDGVIVAEPPHLTWYRDTNGDGLADQSSTWFSGFGRTNVQGMVNSLRWGIDGWIHGATSSAGAKLESSTSEHSIDLGRRDFAIDPVTQSIRPASGGGQHGMSFNRWGDKFVTSNSDHLQQIIDMELWLTDNPTSVPFPSVRRSIAEDGPQAEVYRASPVEPWRIVRTRLRASGVVPGIVEGGGRAAGYFTGATGTWIMDYERGFGLGDAEGSPRQDIAIVCDVGSNLVHRKRMIDQGLFWTAQRIDQETELLRSRDIWFRPVQIGDGPDGALYIADMYREVIEHPLSLPPVIKKHLDLTSGRDQGRIWRVTSPKSAEKRLVDLTELDEVELVNRLESEISWQRLMASQVLVERWVEGQLTDSVVPLLKSSAVANSSRPETRILSLWLLHRLEKFPASLAPVALKEENERVLAHAIETIQRSGHTEQVQAELLDIAASTEDSRVQMALAQAAPGLESQASFNLLGLLMPSVKEPLVRATVAAAAGKNSWLLLAGPGKERLSNSEYIQWLSLLLPTWISEVGQQEELAEWIQESLQPDSLRRPLWMDALAGLPSHSAARGLLQTANAQSLVDSAVVTQIEAEPTARNARWLGLASSHLQTEWMEELIQSTTAESIQAAAINSLGWANHPQLASHLIEQFRSMTPSLQQVALRSLLARAENLEKLATALEQQQIARSQIPPDIRQSLVAGKNAELSKRFSLVLSQVSEDRSSTIERYQKEMEAIGFDAADRNIGQEVFKNACAQCHRLGDIGNDVGPPLQQLSEKSPLQLLEAILDPSAEVDPKYAAYSILTEDGVVINGLILQESGNQIVVAEAGGKQTTLDRQSIEQIQATGLSLMPNGLEDQVSPQQMIHLIEFLMK